MEQYPKRKRNRIDDFDYSADGAYYVTVCTNNRQHLFWSQCTSNHRLTVDDVPLSEIGKLVEEAILDIPNHYHCVFIDQYCIMPDHVHLIIKIDRANNVRPYENSEAPTISRIVKQFKGVVSKIIGRSIWQKSFYDHCIRNEKDYNEIWEYIEQNPLKYALGYRRG